jgi:hypothetical protein
MKVPIKIFLIFAVVIFASCKKETPYYKISDDMKQYFVYQKGSYWVYRNDSTGDTDSSYIDKYTLSRQGVGDNDGNHLYSFDLITLYFKSKFLNNFQIGYYCSGPNCLTIDGKFIDSNDTLLLNTGPIAYFADWEPNLKIYSQQCLRNCVFTFSVIPKDTVDNNKYFNIIYSKMISIDSTENNPNFYFREIYFAENIGIIKYVEIKKYYNIQRSWSLIRYNVIQ